MSLPDRVVNRPKTLSTMELMVRLTDKARRDELINSWPKFRCSLCGERPATGIWMCRFATQSPPYFRGELRLLCAPCGLADGFVKWNGFMAPRLVGIDLFLTITAPEGDKLSAADRLIAQLLTHEKGEAYLRIWKAMFKPANLSHPIAPAFDMLQALVGKLFPPPAQPKGD